MPLIKSTCCYCGVGCGILIETDGQKITDVKGDPDHPANHGKLCTKGSTLHLTARPEGRALYPMQRRSRRDPLQRAHWNNTLDGLAARFAETIERHGADSVGFYISGQLLTEDYYVFNKLAKALIGTNNIDTNSRLCMSSAVAGYKQTLGADAPPACYEDVDHAQCIFIAGSNTAYAHPVLYRRIEIAKANNPELKIIVVDPRCTDTAREADLHLQILPGSDVALFNGMLHILFWENLINHDYIARYTEGFNELKNTVRDYAPKLVTEICGISEQDLVKAAHWFAEAKATLSLYCQGLNQSSSGTFKNAALINLHLATGQIGKPGAGPFSLTGQPNAMGGREVGGMANLLPAHRDLANPEHRAEVARFWGVDAIPEKPGKTAVEMFAAVRKGEIKLLWIACTNPAQSMPEQKLVREALEKCELVVLQEAYFNTETAHYADVLLPAATWSEKEGTVTNSERCITHITPAVTPPGEARADWQIVVDFAQRLEKRLNKNATLTPYPSPRGRGVYNLSSPQGRGILTPRSLGERVPEERVRVNGKKGNLVTTLFSYQKVEDIFNEHRETTRDRDLDITGMSYALLAQQGPQQWPLAEGQTKGKKRLYEDGIFPTATKRAHFVNTVYKPVAENADARYPFRLNTGRLRDQWHGMSRTGNVAQLFNHVGEPRLSMHPADINRYQWRAGELVTVTSRRGAIVIPIEPSEEMRPGQVFLPMHWGSRFLGGKNNFGINTLTIPSFDAYSKQPELKHCAVKISKAELPWPLIAFALVQEGGEEQSEIQLLEKIRAHAAAMPFMTTVLIGRNPAGVLLRAADKLPADTAWLAELDRLLQLNQDQVLCYDDARRGMGRRILIRNQRIQAVRLSGDITAEIWLKDWLLQGQSVEGLGQLLLLPTSQPPAGFKPRGRVICNCFNISESEINTCLEALSGPAEAVLGSLQAQLKCGTQCGSCIPELKKLISGKTSNQ